MCSMRATALFSTSLLLMLAGCGEVSSGSETGLVDTGTGDTNADSASESTTGASNLNPVTGLSIDPNDANHVVVTCT